MKKLYVALIALVLSNTPATADRYNRWVTIHNDTSSTIMYFYATNVRRDSWGNDRLGSEVVLPGWQIDVNIDDGTGYCRFDLRAVLEDGRTINRYNINVCEVASWTIYD